MWKSGFRIFALGLAAALLVAGPAGAAEVRVMISGGLTAAYKALVPEFEKATGNTVVTAYGPSMGTIRMTFQCGYSAASRSTC
jgi:molybdate transport system substrate-binding protein